VGDEHNRTARDDRTAREFDDGRVPRAIRDQPMSTAGPRPQGEHGPDSAGQSTIRDPV